MRAVALKEFGLPCYIPAVLSKGKRLKLFFERLEAATPVSSADEALNLIKRILNEVEDEHSGAECNPDAWKDDGRMYPPQEDSRRDVPDSPSLRRYRSAKHNTLVGLNGSIRIQDLDGKTLIEKAGSDGLETDDLDA